MTPEQRQRLISQNQRLKAYSESGDSNMVSRLISMAYLTASVSNAYNEEAIDIMHKYDLVHKKLKNRSENLTTAFDLYDKAVSSLIVHQDAMEALCEDYEAFRTICDHYMGADGYVEKVYVNLGTGVVVDEDDPEATPCIVCRKKGQH